MTPEGKVKSAVKKILNKRRPYLTYFCPVQTGLGETWLDFIVVYYGYYLCIETKTAGKIPTPRQDLKISAIQAAGGVVLVLDETNVQNLEAWLDWRAPWIKRPLPRGPGDTYDPIPLTMLTTPT